MINSFKQCYVKKDYFVLSSKKPQKNKKTLHSMTQRKTTNN